MARGCGCVRPMATPAAAPRCWPSPRSPTSRSFPGSPEPMKHASSTALDGLEPLLVEIRTLAGLKETSRGVFYLKSRAFLHFHEDPKGLFADVRDAAGRDFERIDVTEAPGRA